MCMSDMHIRTSLYLRTRVAGPRLQLSNYDPTFQLERG